MPDSLICFNNSISHQDQRHITFKCPKFSTNTFAYSAIKEWNNLDNSIKDTKGEQSFKEKAKNFLREAARNLKNNDFSYH